MTQDRLAERRFVAALGIATAPWREVPTRRVSAAAAAELGTPLRLKAPIGGYDGRSQVRIATPNEIPGALEQLGRPPGTRLLVERELDFAAELSVITARAARRHPRRLPDRPQPPRRRHPGGVGRPGTGGRPWSPCGPGARRPHRRGARRRRPRDRRALPAAATARSPSTSWRRASTTAATGRSRAPGPASSSSTSGRSAGCRWATPTAHGPTAMVNLLGHRRVARGPPGGRRGRAGRPARPSPRLRQAAGLRAPQDGPPDRGRGGRRRGRPRPRAGRPREAALVLSRA